MPRSGWLGAHDSVMSARYVPDRVVLFPSEICREVGTSMEKHGTV